MTPSQINIQNETVPTLFWRRVHDWADNTALRAKVYGIWRKITWREYGQKARYAGLGLISLGLEKGDRVTIISENNPEWLFSDMGAMCAGGISVGIYPTDSPQQVEYVLNHCQAKFYIAEDEEQLDKVLEVRERTPHLKKIIVMDMEGLRHFEDDMCMSFDDLLELGKKMDEENPLLFEQRLREPQPEDTAILIYTSGTTGPPKGAMITHSNILNTMDMQNEVNAGDETDEVLSFLPLCHIAQRTVSVFAPLLTGGRINFVEEMDTIPQNMQEVSPTIFFAVPRIWEKFYSSLILTMKESTRFEKLAFKWATGIGQKLSDIRLHGQEPPVHLKVLFKLADWAVLRNLKKVIGLNRARYCMSGAAPISPDLLKFYHGLGLDIREVYGQTENCGPTTVHYSGHVKFGTVGQPLPRAQVKIAEDGEILLKGPHVFKGYFNDPEKTAETVIDGWLYTGDVGRIDEDGHLIITDRKKDIIITAGGKNITPSEIENQLKFSPYITDAVVIGDGRKYLTALIMVDDENVMKFAQENKVPFTTYASLTKAQEVVDLIQNEVEEVNKQFARVETVKKFRLIDIQLTTDDDEITPTGKLKRNFVNEKFKDVIESMY
ncbi:Long-chain-fatty-acid CoA ligase (AMP-forming) [Desulfatibacillum aliphaticivorans]|uniref:Long-chain-fatty-acid CoA ligase (AMP-forming) n=1 Tax=Desulfatibacillum aliphaticivorans TaxID=218208 RepID=B8FKG1_DESAL|nr:AMP-binding protein [Desulfatibacillum aliphaticivorans]ACL01776.1 Long-chain-fatty-acid CoA ligase (AMP-forming) [Desulfatibacillum aliphaticivorans]